MLIFDFRTGKMTKMALDLEDMAPILLPGAVSGWLGLIGALIGDSIDTVAGTGRRWTKILGLSGLLGGLGFAGYSLLHSWRHPYRFAISQARRFLNDAQRRPTASDTLSHQNKQELLKLQPAELFNRLTTSIGGSTDLGSYNPRLVEYRFVGMVRSRTPRYSEMLPIARGVGAQQVLLSKAWPLFSGQTRQNLASQFNEYKNELAGWIAEGQNGSPAAALQILQNMANLIKADGQKEIADALIQLLPIRVGE